MRRFKFWVLCAFIALSLGIAMAFFSSREIVTGLVFWLGFSIAELYKRW